MSIKVKIENFQSIKEVEFEIDRYTVLTGPSNSGKSAICRAIEGALFNRPGDGFVRNGEKSVTVTITTDTYQIIWTKGSGKNHYEVNGLAFDKVGTDVPQPILDIGFKEVELSRTKLRPQMGTDQFDILFLIREQGSLISEVFSVLGRLDVITKAGKECSTDLKGRKSLLKTRYDDLASIDNKLSKYQGFEKVSLMAESLDIVQQEIKENQETLSLMVDSRDKLVKTSSQMSALDKLESMLLPKVVDIADVQRLNTLKRTNITLKSLSEQLNILEQTKKLNLPDSPSDKLFYLVKKLSSLNSTYLGVNKKLSVLDLIDNIPEPLVVKDSEIKKLEGLKKASLKISSISKQIKEVEYSIEVVLSTIESAERDLHELMGSMEECPLCNRVMEKEYVL